MIHSINAGGNGPTNFPLDTILRHLLDHEYDLALAVIAQFHGTTPTEDEQLSALAAIVRAMEAGDIDALTEVSRLVDTPHNAIAAFVKVVLEARANVHVDIALGQLAALQPDAATAVAAQLPPNLITDPKFQLPPGALQPGEIQLPPGVFEPGPIQIGPALQRPGVNQASVDAIVAIEAVNGAVANVTG
jgi:hypothetical protein